MMPEHLRPTGHLTVVGLPPGAFSVSDLVSRSGSMTPTEGTFQTEPSRPRIGFTTSEFLSLSQSSTKNDVSPTPRPASLPAPILKANYPSKVKDTFNASAPHVRFCLPDVKPHLWHQGLDDDLQLWHDFRRLQRLSDSCRDLEEWCRVVNRFVGLPFQFVVRLPRRDIRKGGIGKGKVCGSCGTRLRKVHRGKTVAGRKNGAVKVRKIRK